MTTQTKTPEQIAAHTLRPEALDCQMCGIRHPYISHWPCAGSFDDACVIAAIEVDRAQRQPEPVHPDWQDDADMYRVDIYWRGWTESGAQIGYSDAGITGAQAAVMFEAIGRQEAQK